MSILVYAFLIGVIAGLLVGGLIAGAIGSAVRTALAKVAGKDLPVAFLEDLVAIFGALFIVSRV